MVFSKLAACNLWRYTYWYDLREVCQRLPSNYTADISPQNILTEAEDEINFRDIEDLESQDPSIPIMTDGAPVYKTRNTALELSGIPILTDFGQMRLAGSMNTDW